MNPQLLVMLQDERAAGQREGYARALRELHQELRSMGVDKAVPWAKTLTNGDTAEGSVCMAMALMWLHLERKMEDAS